VNPSPRLTSSCNDQLITCYEELRQQVLGRSSTSNWRPGLALLMRGGMKAWMEAWAPCCASAPVKAQDPQGCEAIIPLGMHHEVVMILAGMILYSRQEARA
jgi:hypothetical protein